MHALLEILESNLALTTVCVVIGIWLFASRSLEARRLATGFAARTDGGERVLILGSGILAREIIDEMGAPGSPWTFVGVVRETSSVESNRADQALGSLADLDVIVPRVRPDRIVVALDERRGRLPVGPLLESRMRGVAVEQGVEFYERLTKRLAIDALTPSALIFSGGFHRRRFAAAAGRGMSLSLSAIGIAFTAPLWPLIALAVRLDSRGPAVFTQERVGRGGRTFGLLKFRSMQPEGANGSAWARDNTARVTRVGRFLRWSHLDELPQLINVLRGDMNLVGPRPHPISNFELFSAQIPFYALRSTIRPGVTGWAQVRYRYANTLEEETEKMRYDLYYIKHRSLWLDLNILARTARVLMVGLRPQWNATGSRATASQTSRARAA